MAEKKFCVRIDGECPHEISKTKKNCFIIMAYEESHSKEIEKILKKAIKSILKLKPILAKHIKHSGSTDLYCTKVCKPIKEATYCIADLTYNNTNVGFEIAVANSFDKPVIITRYIPKKLKIKPEDEKVLKKLKHKGAIQYSEIPNKISGDFGGLLRIDYNSERELKKKLKEAFEIKK